MFQMEEGMSMARFENNLKFPCLIEDRFLYCAIFLREDIDFYETTPRKQDPKGSGQTFQDHGPWQSVALPSGP